MRIAFIHPFLYRYPRGIERFLYHLANALAKAGTEIEILTWRWNAPVRIDTLHPTIRVRELPTSRYFAAQCMVPVYAYQFLRNHYDFVWIFFAGYGEAESLALASLFREIRYGVSLHYPYAQVPHRYREFQRMGCLRNARRVVSTSSYVADGVREAFALDSEIIRTGVDVSQFRPSAAEKARAREALGLHGDDEVVLTVAALEARKGVQHVLDALPPLRARRPRLKYIVLGEGPHRAELEAHVERLGLADVVRLAGSASDVLPYYQAADVFALLSYGEAAPIAPLEAMAMELPLVVSRHRPFEEVVRPEYGLLVDEKDPAAVAAGIGLFLDSPARARSFGEAGRRHVAAEFTWDRIATQYLEASC